MRKPSDATLTGKLSGALRRDLAAGRLRAGDALPSEGELCRKFGVSRVTVRRGLERLRKERLVESRAGVGHFVARSVPGPAAAAGKTEVLYVHDMGRAVEALPALGAGIFAGAVEEAGRQGLDLFLCCLDLTGLRRAVRMKKEATLRGVLFDWNDPEVARFLAAEGVPFVVVEGYFDDLPAAAVVQDDAGGTLAALDHLYAEGRRRMAYLGSDDSWVHRRRREAAFREFHLRRNLALPAERLAFAPLLTGSDGRAEAGRVLALEPRPDAVYLANRELLPGLLAAAAERGLDVPGDLGVVAWGSPEPGDARPELAHLDWDRREMGRMAVRVLADRAARGDVGRMQVLVPARLVEGGSAAARNA